jgi:hypothetical protein
MPLTLFVFKESDPKRDTGMDVFGLVALRDMLD